ncbi:hypothetical protein DFS34DRAFT_634858 [Phlyctochytrium arcticum]|nr:hypothetical protein DFS34DRAFT_634858 [Phlyctochytrium arcticum]
MTTSDPNLAPAKTLLLFVHGFLGSEQSFETFPLDLATTVQTKHHLRNIEIRLFPCFDTKGDPTRAVNQLCNWLLLNAQAPEYSGVIVLGHSMGGIMAVDAFRRLYGLVEDVGGPAAAVGEKGSKPPERGSWLGGLGSWWPVGKKVDSSSSSSSGDAKQQEAAAAETASLVNATIAATPAGATTAPPTVESEVISDAMADTPHLPNPNEPTNRRKIPVNIISLITFDSPFFGLHTNVYTEAARSRATTAVSQYVPSIPVPHIPLHSAFQAIPQAVGAGVQAGTSAIGAVPQAASDAIRYSGRAVGSIPEAAQGLVGAIPSAMASLQGGATSGFQMGAQAVAALPGAASTGLQKGAQTVWALPGVTLQLGSSALAGLPHLFSRNSTTTVTTTHSEPSTADTTTTTADMVVASSTMSSYAVSNATAVAVPELPLDRTSDLMISTDDDTASIHSQMMRDETVLFAQAFAAAAAAVEESQHGSHSTTEEQDPTTLEEDPSFPSPTPTQTPTSASASAVGLLPLPPNTDWTPWVRLGLTGAAVAAGTYYSGGTLLAAPIVRRVAVAWALSHAEEARKHLQFLYILWGESTTSWTKRMEDIKGEVEAGHIGFRAFYIELPPEAVVAASGTKKDPKANDDVNLVEEIARAEKVGLMNGSAYAQPPVVDAMDVVSSSSVDDAMDVPTATTVPPVVVVDETNTPAPLPSTITDVDNDNSKHVAERTSRDRLDARLRQVTGGSTESCTSASSSGNPNSVTEETNKKVIAEQTSRDRLESRLRQVTGGSSSSSLSTGDLRVPGSSSVEGGNSRRASFHGVPKSAVAVALAEQLTQKRSRSVSPVSPTPPSSSSSSPPKTPPPPPKTAAAASLRTHLRTTTHHNISTPYRTFTRPPPQPFSHLFRPIASDCADEIQAHMNMFSRELNAGTYWGLVDAVAEEVERAVKRAEQQRVDM